MLGAQVFWSLEGLREAKRWKVSMGHVTSPWGM